MLIVYCARQDDHRSGTCRGHRYTRVVSDCQRPSVTYPTRVPMKIIGREGELRPEAIAALIYQHLRKTAPAVDWVQELEFSQRPKGAWISYTFWVVLPDEQAERPLREAIQQLPGAVMQL